MPRKSKAHTESTTLELSLQALENNDSTSAVLCRLGGEK